VEISTKQRRNRDTGKKKQLGLKKRSTLKHDKAGALRRGARRRGGVKQFFGDTH